MKIKVTWKAFGDKPEINRFGAYVEFELPDQVCDPLSICERIFHDTNLYTGSVWDIIQPLLSDTRTHTALSVGDEVEIDGQVYVCADMGFVKIEDAVIKRFDDGTIFTVKAKV